VEAKTKIEISRVQALAASEFEQLKTLHNTGNFALPLFDGRL